jgi:glycosyltransferase involved in cell wall biosynthesis
MNHPADTNNRKEDIDLQDVVVVMPTYNNDRTLCDVITKVRAGGCRLIVVDDGSTDGTAEILSRFDDITVLTHPKNSGKGRALKNGLLKAKELSYRYAITIDADGQHFPEDIPAFIEEMTKTPDHILVGARNLTAENMPAENTFANRFSNFWFKLETDIRLEDTQSGFRMYPLKCVGTMKHYTSKYEFELEMLVFAAWKGVNIRNIPVRVYYPPAKERVSHFRPMRDFVRIGILNTLLVLMTLVWRLPVKFLKRFTWKNIRTFVGREIFHSQDSNIKISLSVMLGAFMGIVPIWGYQMLVALFLAHLLKLNKAVTLVAANISLPPVVPFILYGSYVAGCFVTGTAVSVAFGDMSFEILKSALFNYVVGSLVLAVVCGTATGTVSYVLLQLFRKNVKSPIIE